MRNNFFILSRYNEPYNWIIDYSDSNYLIYNKGTPVEEERVINIENIGGNQRDIFKFFYDNYETLPDYMIFIQAYPFDHCQRKTFDDLINCDKLTALEDYTHVTESNVHIKDEKDGGYCEINNSWYIPAHNGTYNQSCVYNNFDEFMYKYFSDYKHLDWIRFAPGSQYLIPKQNALQYPKIFWKYLMEELYKNNMTEAHIIERSLFMILKGTYSLREEFYG